MSAAGVSTPDAAGALPRAAIDSWRKTAPQRRESLIMLFH
jgi:hypothetical protein